MKKIMFTTLMIMMSCTMAMAQKWYGKIGLGFAIPQAAQTMDVTGTIMNGNATYNPANDSISSFSIKKASFSSGFKGIIGVGYNISSHVAIELYADLGVATTNYAAQLDNVKSPNLANLSNDKVTQKSQFPIILIPAIVFKTDKPKFNIYGRTGIVLPLKNQVNIERTSDIQSFYLDHEDIKGTLKTRFNVGFTGAGGVSYLISNGTHFWAEISFTSLALFAKELDITEHTSSASTPITTLLPGTVINYSFSGQSKGNTQPTFSVPYSNMGLNLGVSFDIK